jgi:hypothetical protein
MSERRISILKFMFVIFVSLTLISGWCLSKGEHSKLENILSESISLNQRAEAPPGDEKYYMEQGDYYFEMGEYVKAIENYLEAYKLNNLNYDAAYQIGECLDKLDFIREAIMVHREAKKIRARKDCGVIADAIEKFHKDTGTWPYFNEWYGDIDRKPRVDYLYGNMGDMPGWAAATAYSWGSCGEDMYNSLIMNGYGEGMEWYRPKPSSGKAEGGEEPSEGEGWDGPYLPYLSEDPWGYKYLISVSGFEGGTDPDNHVWIMSGGLNFNVDTEAYETDLRFCDIGIMFE